MPIVRTAPVRGTQSFVGVMGQVWRRLSLAVIEIAWRWLLGGLSLALGAVLFGSMGMDIHFTHPTADFLPQLKSMTVFQPVAAINTFSTIYNETILFFWPWLRWVLLAIFLSWNLIAALGRTCVLRRLDPTLHGRRFSLFLLGTLRALLLAAAWLLWLQGLAYAARTAITAPAARGEEPSLVLFSAMLICGTLFLYVVWGVFSWFLQLAPLLAMRNNLGTIAALRAALTSSKALRGKLIEINLVMNIVRIALLVLAMVMSASPLAFQTVATQQFFVIWWCIAILLYLAASDYFHVVRAAAYLSLHRALSDTSL